MSTITAETIDFLGTPVRVLKTGGDFGLTEMLEVAAGDMPPLHVHHSHDEWFYLLEGAMTFYLPGREIKARAGEFLLGPRGIPHAYRAEEPSRWLVGSTPAGFEQFVVEVGALEELDPAALAAVAARHGIEILGPPGMLP